MGVPPPIPRLDPVIQPQDPLSQYGKILSIKNMMAQQALIPGEIEKQQIQIQQARQQQADQQAMTQAMQAWDGKDYNELPGLVLKHGGSATSVLGLKSSLLKQQQDLATYDETRLKNEAQKNDMLLGHLDAVKSLPDDQVAQGLGQAIQKLSQQGLIGPNEAQQALQLSAQPPAAIRQSLDIFEKGLTGHKAQIEQASKAQADAIAKAKEARDAALAPSELAKSKADADMAQAKAAAIQGGALPEELAKAKYQRILTDIASGKPVLSQDMDFARAYEAGQTKTTSRTDSLGISTTSTERPGGLANVGAKGKGGGGSGGGPLSGSANTLVDQIGQGRIVPERLAYLLAREPGLVAAVTQKYPDFDLSKAQAYPATYKNFTSGQVSKQLNSGSTALRHLAQLKQINDTNPYEARVPGTAANKAYNNLLDTVADELSTFYGEPKTNEAINSKKSTLGGLTNRDAAIQEQAMAMGEKFDELEQTWKNSAPSSGYQAPMPGYSDAAKKARAYLDPRYKYSAPTQSSDPLVVNGYKFPSKAAADGYKRAKGIQ